jgi:hypothetical protein
MSRLKSNMLVSAALRYAATEFIDCVLVRRGDNDAGAIFLHIDGLDGRHKLLARSLDFDGNYSWRSIVSEDESDWVDAEAVERRLAREIDLDPDVFVVEVNDANARNPFLLMSADQA